MPNTNTIADIFLSGSDTTGKGIAVAASVSPGTLIHAQSGTASKDEIHLWASNSHTADLLLVLEFGATGGANQMDFKIPFDSGLFLLSPGFTLTNTRSVYAFCATPNVINIFGHVNRITP